MRTRSYGKNTKLIFLTTLFSILHYSYSKIKHVSIKITFVVLNKTKYFCKIKTFLNKIC